MENILEFQSITLDAIIKNFSFVKEWLQSIFDKIDCKGKRANQLFIAVDEIYTNISNYAYKDYDGIGKITLKASYNQEDSILRITFIDNGIEYNPLYKEDPDIPKHIEKRTIGGLGIFMAKKMVDKIEYTRENSENNLTLIKKLI